MAVPEWFIKDAESAIQQWKHNGRWYVIRHLPNNPYGECKWFLDYADLDRLSGGGTAFRTQEELEEYVKRSRLRPEQQLTLGI